MFCSSQFLSTLFAVRAASPRKKSGAAKNYDFEKKKTAYLARTVMSAIGCRLNRSTQALLDGRFAPEAVIRAWPSSIIGVAANSQKHAPTMSPRMKLNLAIEEHFTPGAAPVAHHNPNNDCL
jgi:hypothetical protein